MKKVKHLGAPIITLKQFAELRPSIKGKVVMTSGAFDPIHPGHVSCFIESKKLGDILVVVINGDWFLTEKKGKPFQDLTTRSLIVSGLREVDYVIPFEIEGDIGQSKTLEAVRPDIFTKGGNRSSLAMLPKEEADVIKKNKINVRFNIGANKLWSSSDFLEQWVAFRLKDKESIKRVKEFYKLSYSGLKSGKLKK